MSERITLGELQRRVADPDVPKSSLAPYFRLIPNTAQPFMPFVVIDPELVEMQTVRGTMAMNWLNDYFAARRQEQYRRLISAGYSGRKILAEGDSWFQFPNPVGDLDDVIEHLSDQYAIFCLSAAGDTLENMSGNAHHLIEQIRKIEPDIFLFSGGGNDMAGPAIAEYVRGYQPGFQPANCLSVRFNWFTRKVEQEYETLFARLVQEFPKLKIYCHGYDWAHPRRDGPWIGPHFHDKGLPEEMWAPIVRIMIDRINGSLQALAARFPGHVHHIDCRGAIGGVGEWRDELHARPEALKRVAARFSRTIEAAFTDAAS